MSGPLGKAEHVDRHVGQPRVTATSTRCRRDPASQSMCSAEWCTAWKRHSNGTRWKARCTQYCVKSATSDQQHELHHARQRRDRALHGRDPRPVEQHHRRPQRQERRHLHEQRADEEVREVGSPARAEERLLRETREQPLERHEHRRVNDQVEQEPVEPEEGSRLQFAGNRHRDPPSSAAASVAMTAMAPSILLRRSVRADDAKQEAADEDQVQQAPPAVPGRARGPLAW